MEKEINYRKMGIPSGPGAEQITNDGCKALKGGAPLVSEMPKDHVIPAASSKNMDSPGKKY